MVASACSTSRATKIEDIRIFIAREKQLKGWRREKKLNLIRTVNPEFKDLAETWGWKMITVHEKMNP
jgi:putative endonuclease